MTSVAFIVPGQPYGKGRPRVGSVHGHARMFTPAKTVSYEGLVAHCAYQAMAQHSLLTEAVEVTLDIVCQVPASWSAKKQAAALAGRIRPTTKPDIDNVEKICFDAMNGVVWKDDVQVVGVSKRKRYGQSPGVTVTVALVDLGQPLPVQAELPIRVREADNAEFFGA